jgi:Transposase DDE domain group 1
LIHTAAYWLMLSLRGRAPRTAFWRDAQFDTIRLCLIKLAARVTEIATRIKVALPTAFPFQAGFADLAGCIAKRPP